MNRGEMIFKETVTINFSDLSCRHRKQSTSGRTKQTANQEPTPGQVKRTGRTPRWTEDFKSSQRGKRSPTVDKRSQKPVEQD